MYVSLFGLFDVSAFFILHGPSAFRRVMPSSSQMDGNMCCGRAMTSSTEFPAGIPRPHVTELGQVAREEHERGHTDVRRQVYAGFIRDEGSARALRQSIDVPPDDASYGQTVYQGMHRAGEEAGPTGAKWEQRGARWTRAGGVDVGGKRNFACMFLSVFLTLWKSSSVS